MRSVKSIRTRTRYTKAEAKKHNLRSLLWPESFLQWTSFSVLDEAINRYFLKKYSTLPAILSNQHDFIIPEVEPFHLVLFSDGYQRLNQRGVLPRSLRYRIWVLGQYSRELLVEKCQISARRIRILPRNELFPLMALQRPFPSVDQPLYFVYAGRVGDPGKNFDLVCAFVSRTQKVWPAPVYFEICGPNLDTKMTKVLVRQHRFKTQPTIHEDLGTGWFRHFKNSVFISLSTFVGEDFGVSAAQAQQNGMPMVVSDWGGHREISGDNVIKIPIQTIKRANDEKNYLAAQKLLVDAFMRKLKTLVPRGTDGKS